jgi:hypothetical protein
MIRLHTTATRLEFYLVWLALRRLTRSADAVAEPLRHAIAVFLDRIDVLLDLDVDGDRRREIAEVLESFRGSRLTNGALRGACSRLADLLALVISEPDVPLRRPRIDQITYIRLVQLAVQIRDHEPGAGDQLYAEQLAERAGVSLDRVHAAIGRMLADGIAHLPVADERGRADAFRLNEPWEVNNIVLDPDAEHEWQGRERRDRDNAVPRTSPNPLEVVVVHGRGTARTAFLFELLRRLGLRPLAVDELAVRPGPGAPSTRELIRAAFARAQAVIIVFTGDDLAGLRPGLGAPQPYLHVIFEAGIAVALQHARTIIVEMPPSSGLLDLADVHTVGFSTGAPGERHQLVRRLRAAGCDLDTEGSKWLSLEFPPSPSQPDT